ncbi:MAG: prepilin-type N-terminal cleavage/methylation domain-containing protein [Candidatus Sumerlaeota bacterium]|nr:prepilin-type N-terminal cleavage/methylation domain-containing protein [Candidatus Sumerlaeota bacterium]
MIANENRRAFSGFGFSSLGSRERAIGRTTGWNACATRIASRRRSGVTLVELLVAIAASVLIAGAVYGVYDTTSRLSRRSLTRESMWAEAVQIEQTIEEALRGRVAPADLQLPAGAPGEKFAGDELVVYSSDAAPGAAVSLVRIANKQAFGDVGQRVVITRGPMSPRPGASEQSGDIPRDPGLNRGRTTTRVRFRAAYQYNGLEPAWAAEPLAGQAPKIVEFEIVVSTEGEGLPPVTVTGETALGP